MRELCTACAVGVLVWSTGCGHGLERVRPSGSGFDRLRAQCEKEEALRLIEGEKLDEAEDSLWRALDADPYDGPAHCNLGVVLLRQGKLYDAAWHLQYASKLMPRASAPRANLGQLYEAAGKYGLAEQELREALELAPDDIEVVGALARVHVRQGKRTDETAGWLETVATQDDNEAWSTWARLQLSRVTDRACESGR